MVKDKIEPIDILLILLTIGFVILILWKIFGDSPTEINLLVYAILTLVGWNYKLNREVGEIKTSIKHIENDVSELKNKSGGK